MTAKEIPWVAYRPDSQGAYCGTQTQMLAKIVEQMKLIPSKPWYLAKVISVFEAEVLPPKEILIEEKL